MQYGKDYFGFVYIWYDRAEKMYYIGSHMGPYDDGYICSSKSMKDEYRSRPFHFMRRILYWHKTNDRKELLQIEGKWLLKIPLNILGEYYYNLIRGNPAPGPHQIEAIRNKANERWNDPILRAEWMASMKDRKETHCYPHQRSCPSKRNSSKSCSHTHSL